MGIMAGRKTPSGPPERHIYREIWHTNCFSVVKDLRDLNMPLSSHNNASEGRSSSTSQMTPTESPTAPTES